MKFKHWDELLLMVLFLFGTSFEVAPNTFVWMMVTLVFGFCYGAWVTKRKYGVS